MKCRICVRECPPGAKICRDCAAARKRAFAATVTQPLLAAAGAPSLSQPRFAPRPIRRPHAKRAALASSETTLAASATDRDSPPVHVSVKWLLFGVAIATTIVIVVIKILASGSGQAIDATSDAEKAVTAALVPLDPDPARAFSGDRLDTAGVAASKPVPREATLPDKKTDAGAAAKSAATKATGRRIAGKVEAPKAVPTEPPAPKPEPVAAAPRIPPSRAIEAPRDPWQAMNEGLSRCARENFFSRVACEQRLRLQYCENYWGTVPQCPIGPTNDHGQ